MPKNQIYSIGLFIDGGYFMEMNKGLHPNSKVNLKGMMGHIRTCIAEKFELPRESCIITESHYFQGRFKAYEAKQKQKLESDRKFEDKLIENDVVFHYKHIYEMPDGTVKEKGIDVWFALETYELAVYRDFDFVVLITGDADHEMLARKIKSLKKQVVLLTWNFADSSSTAPALKEEVTYHIDLNAQLKQNPELINKIAVAAGA